MTPREYTDLATEYMQAGRDADADVCRIMAEEAQRLARYLASGPIDDNEADLDPSPPLRSYQVVTPNGTAWTLPGIDPEPMQRGDATQYRLL